jgi:starvation-inducible DNA-binding protein
MPPSAVEMVRILTQGHEAVIQTARMAFPVAQSANDQPTLSLLVRRIGTHEKFMWMLRSMDDANS